MAGAAPEAAAFDPIALGTEIQRRIGVKTSRDEPLARFTTMRVGGRADLFAVAHNAFELRGARQARPEPRRARTWSSGGGATWSSPTPASAGSSSRSGPRAPRSATSGSSPRRACRWPAPRRSPRAPGCPGSSSGWRSRAPSAAPSGRTPAPTSRTSRAILESAQVLTADGTEARLDAAELGLGYRDSRLKHPPAGGPAEVVLTASFRLVPATPDEIRDRLDEIRRWRQAHQPLGHPERRVVLPEPARGLGRPAHRGRRPQGDAGRRRHRQREARQLPGQRPEGHGDRRPPARRARPGRGRPAVRGRRLEPEVVFARRLGSGVGPRTAAG